MDLDELTRVAAIAAAAATIVGVPMVLVQFRHRRSANFTNAWKEIAAGLQGEKVQIGRNICRLLPKRTSEDVPIEFPDDESCRAVLSQCANAPSATEIDTFGPKVCLERYVSYAYDAFDLAAILAWHSKIPGLWHAVAMEWHDGIIATWDAGGRLLLNRKDAGRTELFECFSALYVTARRCRTSKRDLYPYRGPLTMLTTFRPRWWIAKQAKALRDRLLHSPRPLSRMQSH